MEFTGTPFAFDLQLEQEFQRFVEAYTTPQMTGPSNPPTGFPLVDNESLTMPWIIDSPSSLQRFPETYTDPYQIAGPSNPPIDLPLVNNAMPHSIGYPFSSNAYPPFFDPAPNTDFPSSFMTPQGMATTPTRDRFMQTATGPIMDGPIFTMGPDATSSVANMHPPTFTTPQSMTAPLTQGPFLPVAFRPTSSQLEQPAYMHPRDVACSSQSSIIQDPLPIQYPVEDLRVTDDQESAAHPNAQTPVRTGRRYLRENQRIKNLQNDPYVASFTSTEVECDGCGKIIQLDSRARYYLFLWTKHRSRCVGIVG